MYNTGEPKMSEQQSFQSGGGGFTPLQTSSGKVLKVLPRAFQVVGAYGLYTYKFSIDSSVVDAAPYVSRSGMSSRACYIRTRGQLTPIRGLWRISEMGLTYGYRTTYKITREDLTDPGVVENVFGPMLANTPGKIFVMVDNYGFRVWSDFRKCPTLQMLSTAQQGSLFVYRIHPMTLEYYYELFHAPVEKHELFNHVFAARAVWGGPGIGIVYSDQQIDVEAADHRTISLPGGAYIFTHRPPIKRRVD